MSQDLPAEQPRDEASRPGRRIDLTRVARIILLLAPWAFIAYLFRDLDAVADAFEDASVAPMLAGLLLTLAGLVAAAFLWTRLVGHLSRGFAVPDTPHLMRSFARSWLARYLPGKVWSYGARVVHTDAAVTPRRILATSLVDEFALTIASASALGFGLWTWAAAGPLAGLPVLMAAIAVGILAIARLDRVVELALRLVARAMPERWRTAAEEMQSTSDDGGLGLRASALFVAAYVVLAFVLSAAFVLVVLSLGNIGWEDFPLLVGGYSLAGVVGVMAFFAPAGLGVREGVLAGFLTPVVGGPVAASLAILVRVLVVLADLLFVGIVEVATAISARTRAAPRRAVADAPHRLSNHSDRG